MNPTHWILAPTSIYAACMRPIEIGDEVATKHAFGTIRQDTALSRNAMFSRVLCQACVIAYDDAIEHEFHRAQST